MTRHPFRSDPLRPSHCTCGEWREDRCHEFEQHNFVPSADEVVCPCGQLRTDPVHRGYSRPEEKD